MNITIHKFSSRNLNLQLQTLIAKKKKLFKWVKIDILLPIYVLNSIFVEDLKTQILKFEAKKNKNKIKVIPIDYSSERKRRLEREKVRHIKISR